MFKGVLSWMLRFLIMQPTRHFVAASLPSMQYGSLWDEALTWTDHKLPRRICVRSFFTSVRTVNTWGMGSCFTLPSQQKRVRFLASSPWSHFGRHACTPHSLSELDLSRNQQGRTYELALNHWSLFQGSSWVFADRQEISLPTEFFKNIFKLLCRQTVLINMHLVQFPRK